MAHHPSDLSLDAVDRTADLLDRFRGTLSALATAGQQRFADGDTEGVGEVLGMLAETADAYDEFAFTLVSRIKRETGLKRVALLAELKAK